MIERSLTPGLIPERALIVVSLGKITLIRHRGQTVYPVSIAVVKGKLQPSDAMHYSSSTSHQNSDEMHGNRTRKRNTFVGPGRRKVPASNA